MYKPLVVCRTTTLSIKHVTEVLDVLFKTLRKNDVLIQQQLYAFGIFIFCLDELVGLVGQRTSIQVQTFQPDTRPGSMSPCDSPFVFAVSTDCVIGFIRGRGSNAFTVAASLGAERFDSTVTSLAVSLTELEIGVATIRPERDS